VFISHFSCACYMSHPSHPPWFREQISKAKVKSMLVCLLYPLGIFSFKTNIPPSNFEIIMVEHWSEKVIVCLPTEHFWYSNFCLTYEYHCWKFTLLLSFGPIWRFHIP
jgi:hypothetical protein